MFVAQRSLLYVPDRSRPALGALAALGFREIGLTTADGLSLLSWYRKAPEGAPTIAYFHGNGGNLGNRAERMARFAGEGLGVLLLEYRGYGGNPGRPSEAGLYADAAAALAFLSEHEKVPPDRLVVYGESLGSGVAVHMAAGRPLAALILEAPFTSMVDAAVAHYPWVPVSLLLRDRFESLSRIGAIEAPLLVLHGERDRVVPIRLGRGLYAAAPAPKEAWVSPEAGHANLARFGAFDAVFDFLRRRVPGS